MIEIIKKAWVEKPLQLILIIALALRLLAAFFAQGYGMHDDHFGPIQQPYDIISDYTVWEERGEPHGHSIVYPSLHYYLFKGLNTVGVDDPQIKMYVVRILHAFYSVLMVFFGYRITQLIADKETAKKAGLMLATFWIFPFMSVRNLIEMVCIPPLMAGFYYAMKDENKRSNFVIVGIMFGLAFIFRYQTVVCLGGLGLIWLFKKQFLNTVLAIVGFVGFVSVVQGTADYLAWGYAFAAPMAYFLYNSTHGNEYTSGPIYQYVLLIFGLLIPPASAFLLYGLGRSWKKHLILFLPMIIFLALHSYYPNKQERFILPILPIIIILAIVGWERFIKNREFSGFWRKTIKGSFVWYWSINTLLLVLFTFTYSKKTRVEPLYFLSKKDHVSGVIVETGRLGGIKQPTFYLNKKDTPVYELFEHNPADSVKVAITRSGKEFPNYVIFYGIEQLEDRVIAFQKNFTCSLTHETQISPSLLDDVFYKLNPKHNKNQTANVYAVSVTNNK